MKRIILFLTIIAASIVAQSQSRTIQFESIQEMNNFKPKWNEDVVYHEHALMAVVTQHGLFRSNTVDESIDSIPTLNVIVRPNNVRQVQAFMQSRKCTMYKQYDNYSVLVYRMPKGMDYLKLQNEAMQTDYFKSIEQEVITEANSILPEDEAETRSNSTGFNDPLYPNEYAYVKMQINEALAMIPEGRTGIITIIDGHGYDLTHEDMQGVYFQPYNAVNGSSNVSPEFKYDSHGTCCAGIPGGICNNAKGVAGLGGNKLLVQVIKIGYNLTSSGSFNTSSLIQIDAMNHAKDAGSLCVSMSYGGGSSSAAFQNAITDFRTNGRNGKGGLVFASSGNSALSSFNQVPASYQGVISVGASTNGDLKASYSNYGTMLTLAAPGSGIWTTDQTGDWGYSINLYGNPNYYSFSGTSAASPVAATAGALTLLANPTLTEPEAKQILINSCQDVGGYVYTNSRCNELGAGRLNAALAVSEALGYVPPVPTHDLSLSNCAVSPAVVNQPCVISCRVSTNNPSLPEITSVVEYRFSTDPTFSTNDILIGTDTSKVGNNKTFEDESIYYTPTVSGYIVFRIDGLTESNNNCFAVLTVTTPPAPDGVDATPVIVTAIWDAVLKKAKITWKVNNTGNVTVSSFKMAWGFNTNPTNVKPAYVRTIAVGGSTSMGTEAYPTTLARPVPFSIKIFEVNGAALRTPRVVTVVVN